MVLGELLQSPDALQRQTTTKRPNAATVTSKQDTDPLVDTSVCNFIGVPRLVVVKRNVH